MLLDTSGFAAGINTSVAMLGVYQRAQAAAFAPNGPKIDVAQFQAEIAGLNNANATLQNSLKRTAGEAGANTVAYHINVAAVAEDKAQVEQLNTVNQSAVNIIRQVTSAVRENTSERTVAGGQIAAEISRTKELVRAHEELGAVLLKQRLVAAGNRQSILPLPPEAPAPPRQTMMSGVPGSQGFIQTYAGLQSVNSGMQTVMNTSAGLQSQNVRLGSSFQNLGVNLMSLQAGFAVFSQGKAIVMEFVNEANKLQATNLAVQNVANFKGIPQEQIQSQIQSLDIVKNGLLTYGEAAQGVSNLMRSGLNLQQSIDLLKGFTDSAVSGRQASLELGYAVVSGTEGWRNNNNLLLDNMGMTTNISVLNKRAGISEEELANKMNDSSVAARQYDVVMKELSFNKGNASKYTETFAGQQSQLNTEILKGKIAVGEYLQEALQPLMKNVSDNVNAFTRLNNTLKQFDEHTPSAVKNIRTLIDEFATMNNTAFVLNQMADGLERVLSLLAKAKQGIDQRPMGPELPPGFMRTGRGGEMEGIDYAGKSTFSNKSRGGNKGGNDDYEYTTDYSRLQEELVNTEKEFELLKTQLASSGVEWNNNLGIIQEYIKAIDELKTKLAGMTTDFVTPTNERIKKGSEGLAPGTVNRRAPDIGPVKLSDAEQIMIYGKTKEQMQAGKTDVTKDFLKNASQFGGALSNITSTLGLTDTAFGTAADVVSGFASTVGSVMQVIGAFGGGGGFDLLGSLFGAGLGFVTGGPAGAVVGGIGGGGGMGGSIRGNSYNGSQGGYQGNISNLISSQSQSRSYSRDRIIGAQVKGDKIKFMLEDVDARRGKLLPVRRAND